MKYVLKYGYVLLSKFSRISNKIRLQLSKINLEAGKYAENTTQHPQIRVFSGNTTYFFTYLTAQKFNLLNHGIIPVTYFTYFMKTVNTS